MIQDCLAGEVFNEATDSGRQRVLKSAIAIARYDHKIVRIIHKTRDDVELVIASEVPNVYARLCITRVGHIGRFAFGASDRSGLCESGALKYAVVCDTAESRRTGTAEKTPINNVWWDITTATRNGFLTFVGFFGHNLDPVDKYLWETNGRGQCVDESTRQATRLWTLAQPSVSAFVTSVVRDFRDRDDVLQDVAVAVIDSFDSYDSQKPFVAWAIGVARNQIGLYLRKRRRDRLVFNDETVACLAVAFSEVAPEQPHQLDFLRDCLQSLEERARRLCELRYRDDLKPAAISALVGQSANAVAKSLQRIRDLLRECIERKSREAAVQ